MKILVDEMYQNIYLSLKKLNYDIYSVRNLIEQGLRIRSDYSIIKYAEQNRMILITRDGQNKIGCEENGIPCISLGENPDVNLVIAALAKIEADVCQSAR